MQPAKAGADWTPSGSWCAMASEMFATHTVLNLLVEPLTQSHRGEGDQRFQRARIRSRRGIFAETCGAVIRLSKEKIAQVVADACACFSALENAHEVDCISKISVTIRHFVIWEHLNK